MSDEIKIVEVKLTQEDYKVLQQLIKEREAYNVIKAKLANFWVWTVAAGAVSLFVFWEQLHGLFTGSK